MFVTQRLYLTLCRLACSLTGSDYSSECVRCGPCSLCACMRVRSCVAPFPSDIEAQFEGAKRTVLPSSSSFLSTCIPTSRDEGVGLFIYKTYTLTSSLLHRHAESFNKDVNMCIHILIKGFCDAKENIVNQMFFTYCTTKRIQTFFLEREEIKCLCLHANTLFKAACDITAAFSLQSSESIGLHLLTTPCQSSLNLSNCEVWEFHPHIMMLPPHLTVGILFFLLCAWLIW